MNDMNRYAEEWFSVSYTAFADDEFDIMEEELFREFDKLTREFDRIFNASLNELEFSESYVGVKSDTLGEEIDVIPYSSYPVNLRPNNNIKARKTRRNIKPVAVQRHNHLNSHNYNLIDDDNISVPLPRIEKEESDSLEDIIVTDKNIKVVSQLPVNNRRKDIKVVAYNDNSVTISHLSTGGKRHYRTSVIPYNIDIETARSTYKNGILEITFNRK
jgi:HSP20 family molecular chaperone IbpA